MQELAQKQSKLLYLSISKKFLHRICFNSLLVLAIFNHPKFLSPLQAEILQKIQPIFLSQTTAEDILRQGNSLYKQNRYEDALVLFEKAIELNPNLAVAWNNRSRVLRELKRYAEAITSSDKAVALIPSYGDAWYNRGTALVQLLRYEEAIISFEKAIQIKPSDGDATKSLQEAQRMLQIKPTFPNSVSPLIPERGQPTYGVNFVWQLVDITSNDAYFEALKSLIEKYGIALNYQDNTFKGDEPLTRGEMVYMLATSFDMISNTVRQSVRNTSCRYIAPKFRGYVSAKDILDAWYSPNYKRIAEVTGDSLTYPDGTFQGYRAVTKGEMAVFLNRFADSYNLNFSTIFATKNKKDKRDLDKISQNIGRVSQISDVSNNDYYFDDLQSLVERYGALAGYPDGTYRGSNVVTRGEFIYALNALLDKLNEIFNAGLIGNC